MKILKLLEESKIVEFRTSKDGQLLVSTYPQNCDCDKPDEITVNSRTRYLSKKEALKMIFELIEVVSDMPECAV